MIKIDGLYKSLGGQAILANLSFEVNSGEIIVLLGPSGTGKTVLLKHLIGLMRPDRGRVLIDGQDIATLNEKGLLKVRQGSGVFVPRGCFI
jgi:ABC-type transport system involved in resistance to organic solvents, ATPase component